MILYPAIICELDNVLCDNSHRLPLVVARYSQCDQCEKFLQLAPIKSAPCLCGRYPQNWKPDYEAYHAAMVDDKPNEWCSDIIYSYYLYDPRINILITTSSSEKYKHFVENNIEKSLPDIERTKYIKFFMKTDFIFENLCNICDKNYSEEVFRCSCFDKRPNPDHLPYHIVKSEMYEREIRGKYNVLFVLESDPDCIKMYRNLGLTVLDCGSN